MKILVNAHKCEIEKSPVNEKEINITKCEFEFSEEITNEYVKDVYFTLDDKTIQMPNIQDNECDIPYEVLAYKGQIEIGVVAYLIENDEYTKRYNPSPVYIQSWVGSLKDEYDNTEEITPSDKEQLEQELNDGLQEISEAVSTITTAVEQANTLDLDVSKSGKIATVELTKKDGTVKTVTLSDGTNLEFNWSGTSLGIKTDDDADYTYVDLQGVQGEQGPMGAPFTIKKTYSSVAEMNADFNNMNVGDYVMITSTVEVEDNAKLYCKGTEAWIFITDFSGATGIQGPTGATPNIQIGTVTTGETSSVTRSGTNENPVLNFVLEKGDTGATGQTGATGNGIASIEKTSTIGLTDIYTITYTNGQTTTFTVINGEVSLEQLRYCRTIENALPKITGTGTSITLNNTVESPMRMKLEPSELSQDDTPTPSNPQNVHVITGNNTITITNSGNTESQALTLTLGSLEYCKFGDNKDEFYKATASDTSLQEGKWYLKKIINKKVLNGSETWTARYLYTNTVRLDGDILTGGKAISENKIITDKFVSIYGDSTDMEHCRSSNSDYPLAFIVYINKNRIDNPTTMSSAQTSFRSWLSSNNVIVYYVLETPTYTLLNDTQQAELDNIYEWAKSYQNQTNISQTNADLPFYINGIAIRDMSNIFELIS